MFPFYILCLFVFVMTICLPLSALTFLLACVFQLCIRYVLICCEIYPVHMFDITSLLEIEGKGGVYFAYMGYLRQINTFTQQRLKVSLCI